MEWEMEQLHISMPWLHLHSSLMMSLEMGTEKISPVAKLKRM